MKYLFAILIIYVLISCHKTNTTNEKFLGTWHQKPGGVNDTVTFYSTGKIQDKLDMNLVSYSIISSDTMQINTNLSYTFRSYYFFYSDTELGIQSFEANLGGFGYDSITLIKN